MVHYQMIAAVIIGTTEIIIYLIRLLLTIYTVDVACAIIQKQYTDGGR